MNEIKIPQWWEITLGVILIVLGFSLMFLFKNSKKSVEEYKKEQLKEFKKQNPKFKGDYEQSKLLLPLSQRFKLTLWPIVGLSLIIVGIFLSTGFMFTFFVR